VTAARDTDRGAALVVGLLLLLVLTILGTTGMVTATLELQMAGNAQSQERAFQAAEFAIEQALQSADLRTDYTLASPKVFPAAGGSQAMPGSAIDTYSYRLYFDTSAARLPPPGDTGATGLVAYYFVVAATGSSERGATAALQQSFYVAAPETCFADPAGCRTFSAAERRRTYWIQAGAE
jgi:type II secretory pathway pseudopilin PulG